MQYCTVANYHYVYITYGIFVWAFGETPIMLMFWLFPENGSISKRTVNRALIVHTTLSNSAFKKYIYSF